MATLQISLFFYCFLCFATWTQVTHGNPVETDQVANMEESETAMNEFQIDADHECQLNNASSCPSEHCCVKEILIYQPGFKGQKAAKLVCRRMRDDGELCILKDTLHICPCREGLECVEQDETDYGHCMRL